MEYSKLFRHCFPYHLLYLFSKFASDQLRNIDCSVNIYHFCRGGLRFSISFRVTTDSIIFDSIEMDLYSNIVGYGCDFNNCNSYTEPGAPE